MSKRGHRPPRKTTRHLTRPSAPFGKGALMAQAVALFQHGRFREGENLLRQLLAAAPADHAALHLLGVILRERGEYGQAIEMLRKAIGIEARLAPYHGNLGNAYLMSEQFDAAAACYRQVLVLEPGSVLARFGLGMAFIGRKDFAAAVAELEKVVKAERNHVDANSNLGTALSELGRHDEAMPYFERALALKPESAGIHFKYGMALKSHGDLLAACRYLARAAVLDPTFADAPYQVGVVLHTLNRLEDAVRALEEAVKLRPDLVAALYELGQILNQLQSFEQAADYFERGMKLDPQSPLLYLGLARTRHLQGRCQEARSLIAEALAHGADKAECHTMLGLVLQTEGNFDAAIEAYQQAIALNPGQAQAHLCLAMIRNQDDPSAHIQELEHVRSLGALDAEQLTTLEYALAKGYEKLGDYGAAFHRYEAANKLRKEQYPFDLSGSAAHIDRLIATFSKDLFRAKGEIGSSSQRPVFIVGMMRSGTTLVEQIIASHPMVHGHGELDLIRQIEAELPGQMDCVQSYPECIAELEQTTALRLAEKYLARLEQDAPEATRSVDKLPNNFERLGLISLLFPHARIIHCTRDPIDTCLSNFFHDFGSDNRFTYDLETLGRYYRDYQRLMAHWKTVLPIPILELPYEALVADQESWSRRLVEFLDLDWDEQCLAFYKNERPVYTYSLWQVRQPIYTSSIQRWRPYAQYLAPLFDALEISRPAS